MRHIYIAYRNDISGYLKNCRQFVRKFSHALRFTYYLFIFIYKMIMITPI